MPPKRPRHSSPAPAVTSNLPDRRKPSQKKVHFVTPLPSPSAPTTPRATKTQGQTTPPVSHAVVKNVSVPTIASTLRLGATFDSTFNLIAWLKWSGAGGYTSTLTITPSTDTPPLGRFHVEARLDGLSRVAPPMDAADSRSGDGTRDHPICLTTPRSSGAGGARRNLAAAEIAHAIRTHDWPVTATTSSHDDDARLALPLRAETGAEVRDAVAVGRLVRWLWEEGGVRILCMGGMGANGAVPVLRSNATYPLTVCVTGRFCEPLQPLSKYGSTAKARMRNAPRWPFRDPTEKELEDPLNEGIGKGVRFISEGEAGRMAGRLGGWIRVSRDDEVGSLGAVEMAIHGEEGETWGDTERVHIWVDLGWGKAHECLWSNVRSG